MKGKVLTEKRWLPFQFVLMVIEKNKNPTEISNPTFLHHTSPINTSKINKVFSSKVCAVSINISRALLQILLGMPGWKWQNRRVWHCLSQNPSWMTLESTTLNHRIWLQPSCNEPKPKTVVKTHPIHIVFNWPGFIYRYKLFQAFN